MVVFLFRTPSDIDVSLFFCYDWPFVIEAGTVFLRGTFLPKNTGLAGFPWSSHPGRTTLPPLESTMRTLLFLTLSLLAALIGCSTPTSIDANTAAVTDLSGKVDANSTAVVAAINGLGTKLDALVPVTPDPPVVVDPDVCTIPTGMTLTAFDKTTRHVTGTQDAIVSGKMLVVACDVESVQGWQAWNLAGLKLGTSANGQDGLLVDSAGNAVNVDDIRGHYSSKTSTVKGRKFTVACIPGLGPDACKVKKAEKPTSDTITLALPKGAKIVTGS